MKATLKVMTLKDASEFIKKAKTTWVVFRTKSNGVIPIKVAADKALNAFVFNSNDKVEVEIADNGKTVVIRGK